MKPGTIVALKSGGPLMTVRSVIGDWITVDYFSNRDTIEQSTLHKDQLSVRREPDNWKALCGEQVGELGLTPRLDAGGSL